MQPNLWVHDVIRFTDGLNQILPALLKLFDFAEILAIRLLVFIGALYSLYAVAIFHLRHSRIPMKNYYYNPKTRDLTIFDTDTKEMLVLERIEGIRVLTSSEIDSPVKTEPVKKWSNSVWDPASGKAGYKGQRRRKVAKAEKKAGKRSGRWTCKNCGEKGHSAKTCKNPPKVAPPQLPESEIQEIAREERREENA